MKKILSLFVLATLLIACEDVIDVDLNQSEPRLVIDAGITWFKNTEGNMQTITLTLSAPFFDEENPPATGATVTITDSSGNTFSFIEDGNTGIYTTSEFIPVLGATYQLSVVYNNNVYTATEILKSVASIDFIEQNDEGGFTGNDIELNAYFTDPEGEANYYLFEIRNDISVVPDIDVLEDRFFDGNQVSSFYTEDDLEAGNIVTIRNHGISERYYEYMVILLQQGSEDGGGPFETQPATVRGNIVNETSAESFPFGYFRLSEVDEVIYTIE